MKSLKFWTPALFFVLQFCFLLALITILSSPSIDSTAALPSYRHSFLRSSLAFFAWQYLKKYNSESVQVGLMCRNSGRLKFRQHVASCALKFHESWIWLTWISFQAAIGFATEFRRSKSAYFRVEWLWLGYNYAWADDWVTIMLESVKNLHAPSNHVILHVCITNIEGLSISSDIWVSKFGVFMGFEVMEMQGALKVLDEMPDCVSIFFSYLIRKSDNKNASSSTHLMGCASLFKTRLQIGESSSYRILL